MRNNGNSFMFLIFIVFTFSVIQSAGQWSQGTGMNGGDYRCLMKNGSDLYAGSQYGGVFHSTNNGDSWMPRFTGLPAGVSVVSLLAKDTLIFAGTGYWSKQGEGIFRSGDQGATWVQKNNGIEVNPVATFTDLDITGLAKTTGFIFASTRSNGIYRSADNGDSWVKVFDAYGPDSTGTGVDSTIFRQISGLCSIGSAIFAGGSAGTLGIHRSFDNGLTWDVVSTGFPAGFVAYQLISSGSDLYVRGSHGFYWSPVNGDYFIGINNGISKPEGAISGSITAEGSTVFASTFDGSEGPRTYKSINRGSTWTVVADLSTSYVLATLTTGTSVFVGHLGNYGITSNGGGVIRSLDSGTTWSDASIGLRGISCRAMASDGSAVFSGTYYYSGIFKSATTGASWSKAVLPGTTPNSQILAMTNAGTTLYAGVNATNGVYKSVNGGVSWTQAGTIGKQVWAMGSNATYVFAGTVNDGMRRSSNSGTSWTTINTGLPTVGEKSIRAITISGSKIYIGNSRGVFYSSNDGTNWTAINGGVGSPGYTSVKSIAVKGDTLFAGNGSGILRSTNHGATWAVLPAANGLGNTVIVAGNLLYAGGTSGVSMSSDWGETWTAFNNQFPNIPEVHVLFKSNDILYAGTYGQAVWQYSFAQPPAVFAVTGGGTVCEGSSGVSVGLSGSETGVNYLLYKNGVAVPPAIAGTGTAITFSNQTAGTYTVEGTNPAGTTPMNGSATVIETPLLAVSISVTADVNPVPEDSPVTFTAVPLNGGSIPAYQWQVNGTNAGSDNPIFQYNPVNNDVVTCTLTSSEICTSGNPATSNPLIIHVIADTLTLQGIVVAQGETSCYNASAELIVAGNGTTFTVQAGGSATMIAGQRIIYLPGTTADSGSYMLGYITPDGTYCTYPSNPLVNSLGTDDENMPSFSPFNNETGMMIYPNPAGSDFTVELVNHAESGITHVEIYSVTGQKAIEADGAGLQKLIVPIKQLGSGLWFVTVTAGNTHKVIKLIKL